MQSLFVTGTDTGVGKSVVTALLVLRLQRLGLDVGVMKPFATGCIGQKDELLCEDAQWLQAVTGVRDETALICPARWTTPAAPLIAARHEGNAHNDYFGKCLEAFAELSRRHQCVVVEGVGGWLVPLQESVGNSISSASTCTGILTVADFASQLQLPVVIVARRNLGTINHSLLTQRSVQQTNDVAGWVFCDAEPTEESVATRTAAELVAQMSALNVWAQIPFRRDLNPQMMREWEQQIPWNWPVESAR